ncbi:MAG: cyclic nucleotide-binding domain-containing protein [Candidatus Ozemobacteraceae bacterium]
MLENVELFATLNKRELEGIARIALRRDAKRGEVIFQQDDVSRDLFILENGQVEISVWNHMRESRPIAQLRPGDLFGEMALFDPHSRRSATARALQNVSLIVIPGKEFEILLKEKPGISFKLLGALSQRLKATNVRVGALPGASSKQGKVITVASPRNAAGKTTFAITAAHLLSKETTSRVLFIDLDLAFADATYFLGVHTVRTILEFSQIARGEISDFDTLRKHLVHNSETLYTLAAPVNIIDGEKLNESDLVQIVQVCRRFFDFIVLDTDSRIDNILLSALDLADRVFFMVDSRDPYAVKSTARYFFGLGKLNLAPNRMTVLATHSVETLNLKGLSGLFKCVVSAQAPVISSYTPQFGETIYQTSPQDAFCSFIRNLLEELLKVEFQQKTEKGFFTRFFSPDSVALATSVEPPANAQENLELPNQGISPAHVRVLLKYIRAAIVAGEIPEAMNNIVRLLELCGTSSPVYLAYGEILVLEGNTSQAVDAFQKALDLDPSNHMAMGLAAIHTADKAALQKAFAMLDEKISLHPEYPDLYKDYGELLLHKGSFAEAEAKFRESLVHNPKYDEAQIRLAEALGHQGKFLEAIEQLLSVREKNAPTFFLLGNYFRAINRLDEALDSFRLVMRTNPAYRDTARLFAELEEYFDKLSQLIDMHLKLLGLHPDHPDLHVKLAQLHCLVGRRADAEMECKQALKLNPNYGGAQKELARIQKMPVFVIEVPQEDFTHAKHPCRDIVCHGFLIELTLGAHAQDSVFRDRIMGYKFHIRNIRTGKTFETMFSATTLESTLNLKASSICPVAECDILVAAIIHPVTRKPIFCMPHLVTEKESPLCRIRLNIEAPIKYIMNDLEVFMPVRHFLVTYDQYGLPEAESKIDYDYKAFFTIQRTAYKVPGQISPDEPQKWCFVFSSTDHEDVVQSGDILTLQVLNQAGKEIYHSDFTVTPEEIMAFTKQIGIGTSS